jgi:hypothetical protein
MSKEAPPTFLKAFSKGIAACSGQVGALPERPRARAAGRASREAPAAIAPQVARYGGCMQATFPEVGGPCGAWLRAASRRPQPPPPPPRAQVEKGQCQKEFLALKDCFLKSVGGWGRAGWPARAAALPGAASAGWPRLIGRSARLPGAATAPPSSAARGLQQRPGGETPPVR